MKIFAIVSYAICTLIYELGICNYNTTEYNFSMCRIVLYLLMFILLIKYINKFSVDALESLKLKSKKIIIGIYIPIMILLIIYVALKWISIYKILTLVIALIMGLVCIVYLSADSIKNVIILTFTLGIVFTFATDFQHAIDEKEHIMTAANISEGNLDYEDNPLNIQTFNNIIFNCDMDSFAQFYSKKYDADPTTDWKLEEITEFYYICSAPIGYNPILYLPSAMGITFAKVLRGSIADAYITGRLFNLITYAIIVIAILKILPYKKKIFYHIYMIPFVLLLSASYSIDGICIGILGLFIAYCLNLSEKDYKEIKLKQILILAFLFLLCLIVKNLSYCAIITFILVLPIFKILKNNKKNMPILIVLMIIAIIMGLIVALNKVNSIITSGGDPRLGDTSAIGQLQYLINSPMNIIKVCLQNCMNTILNFEWYTYLNNYKFFGTYFKQIFFWQMLFILYVCLTNNKEKINKRISIVSILTFLSVLGTTGIMSYLCFTPVGQIDIVGFQPRYLLPIFPIVLMLLGNMIKTEQTEKTEKMENQEQYKKDVNEYLVSALFIIVDLICLIKI